MTQFLSAHSDKPPRQFQPQVIHGLFFGLFGAAFCQVKVYCRADQRMFLAIGEAIAVQQIGLFPLGQPFASRRISMSTSGRAARIRAIVRRRSEVWYIQIKFSSSTLKFMRQTSISCCLLRAAAFFGLAACFVSESCLRTEARSLRMPLSRFSFGVGDKRIHQLQHILFRVDVDKGVVLHGLGKVYRVQDFHPVACPLEHLACFQNQSPFRVCDHE